MKLKLAPMAICLAFGLSAIAGPAQANNWYYYLLAKKKKEETPVTLPVEPPGNSNPPGHASSYPNGRGWKAVEYDFIDVKKRIDEVKEDTEEILLELDDIDADLSDLLDGQKDLMDGQEALMDGQDVLSDQIEDLAGAVEAQGNVLEVQVRVGNISTDEVSIDSSTVTLYVQVNQNGAGYLKVLSPIAMELQQAQLTSVVVVSRILVMAFIWSILLQQLVRVIMPGL